MRGCYATLLAPETRHTGVGIRTLLVTESLLLMLGCRGHDDTTPKTRRTLLGRVLSLYKVRATSIIISREARQDGGALV